MTKPKLSRSGGPYDKQPKFPPTNTADYERTPGYKKHRGLPGYWAQTRNGKWYAFWSVGPRDTRWNVEHPFDPAFWGKLPDADPYDQSAWCCRHGWMAYSSECGCSLSEPVTDDEVALAADSLARLVRELGDDPVS